MAWQVVAVDRGLRLRNRRGQLAQKIPWQQLGQIEKRSLTAELRAQLSQVQLPKTRTQCGFHGNTALERRCGRARARPMRGVRREADQEAPELTAPASACSSRRS